MTRAKRWLTVTAGLAAGLGLGACNGQIAIGGAASDGGLPGVDAVVDAGSPMDGGGPADAGGSGKDVTSAESSVREGGTSLGTFVGYLENYTFASGSDALQLQLVLGADGTTITGSVVYGNGPAPPSPTNPHVGYPPGNEGTILPGDVVEGFAYPVLQGLLMGSHLTFEVSTSDVWAAWCALQTPVFQPQGGGFYGCLPIPACGNEMSFGGPMPTCGIGVCDGGGTLSLDCGWAILCGLNSNGLQAVCACTASGCGGQVSNGDNLFDMQRMGASLTGSVRGLPDAGGGDINAVLMAQ